MINVAGHFCSHFGTVLQAVPAVMSQVHRRHMRNRLNRKITESRYSEHISLEAEFSTSELMTWLKQHLKYFRNKKCHRLQNFSGNKIAAHDEKVGCNTVKYIQRYFCILIGCIYFVWPGIKEGLRLTMQYLFRSQCGYFLVLEGLNGCHFHETLNQETLNDHLFLMTQVNEWVECRR